MAVSFQFTCNLIHGLHARPASHIAELSKRFSSEISLTNKRSGATADAKSVLSLIASDTHCGDDCEVRVNGPDERDCSAALQALLRDRIAALEKDEITPP